MNKVKFHLVAAICSLILLLGFVISGAFLIGVREAVGIAFMSIGSILFGSLLMVNGVRLLAAIDYN